MNTARADDPRDHQSDLQYLESAEAHVDEGNLGEPAARSLLKIALYWTRHAFNTPAAKWRNDGKPDPHGDRFNGERSILCGGKMTDDELANAVYLEPSIMNLTAAKERIRWLSRKLVRTRYTSAGSDDWRDDPTSDERWNAGCDFAMKQLCAALDVDPNSVTWDAATETVDGDIQAVIWNILREKYGEDGPVAATPTPPSADVATVARFIDPRAFKMWDGLYHHCIKNGDDEDFAKRCADSSHKQTCDEALEKARCIIATIQSAAQGTGTESGGQCENCASPGPSETIEPCGRSASYGTSFYPDVRRSRAQALTAYVMEKVEPVLSSEQYGSVARRILECFYDAGFDVITDDLRRECGLPPRGPLGWSPLELQAIEHRRLEVLLTPPPPIIIPRPDPSGD